MCKVSVQAVSKWECELSYPDIELLPVLANYFNVTIDYLLTGSTAFETTYNTQIPNDETIRIVQFKGQRLLTKDSYDSNIKIKLKVEDAIIGPVEIWGNTDIEGCISGGLNAGLGVNCGNVSRGLNAESGVNCGNVSGGLHAENSMNCGNIEGDIECGGDIHCSEIKGNIQNCKSIYFNK